MENTTTTQTDEQRRPTREDRRHRYFDRDGRPMWISVPKEVR